MEPSLALTTGLILLGGLTMVVAIAKTKELISIIPESKYAINWKLLLMLMVLFVCGYAAAGMFLSLGKEAIVYTLTGLIFFLGAIFVLISVITGKQTIAELKSSLLSVEEKEVMMKEIHHRVKNNLQIIKSLLKLQSSHTKDAEALEMFQESENRIMSMALIHEKLYQTENFAGINVQDYVDELIANLIDVYELDIHVDFEMDITVEQLSIDTLTPFGLLLNEIVSNFKHGFKGRKNGLISISARPLEDNYVRLVIKDNGVGFTLPKPEHKSGSLGVQLIHILADQLDGELSQTQEKGTLYKITFPQVITKKS
jgi:two-component sensor histidine kinase